MKIPYLQNLRKNRKKNDLAKFSYAGQDQLDLISYSGLQESPNHLLIGDKYFRTICISGYPYIASSGWLDMLINFKYDIDISYHIEHVNALDAIPKLERKITELESTRRAMMRTGKIIGSEITDPLDSAVDLKEKIMRGQEKLFHISIYMTISADSINELNKVTKYLESTLATKLFYTKIVTFQQLDGLQSVLPRGENILQQRRNLNGSSLALTFPFVSSEMIHEDGILYGINRSNNSLVIVDRFSLQNANSIIFAQSGSGKSFTAKVEILRQLMQGTKVIVIDPEGEYRQLAESVEGTYIKLSLNSRQKINPFDFTNKDFQENKFSQHIQDLTRIISVMVGQPTAKELSVIDKALLATYKDFGWTNEGTPEAEKSRTFPLLKDFYKTLKKNKQTDLCVRLDKYVTGSLALVFNSQTNFQLNNRFVVFDIKDLDDSVREIMMLVIANYVGNQVYSSPERRLLVIDEAWKLLEHKESAHFITGLVRRARKYYLGVSLISQQANDFLNNEYGRVIAAQSALKILLKQDTTTIKKVVQEFNLSEYERKFLLTCERGEGIIIADQNHVAIKVLASDQEYPLITTDPREIYG